MSDLSALELEPDRLQRRVDPAALPFSTTAQVEPLVGTIGQPRALKAIEFGLEAETLGFNLFVAGAPGSGRSSTVRDYLERFSQARAVPRDWIYVHNFREPDRPNAIGLPAGRGAEFARDMATFTADAKREIPRAFESEQYDSRQREIAADVKRRGDALAAELKEYAAKRQFALEVTPVGVASSPLLDGRPMTRDQFEALPPQRKEHVKRATAEIETQTASFLRRMHALEKETVERVRELEREVTRFATGRLFHELRDRYADDEEILGYLDDVEADILDHVDDFREPEDGSDLPVLLSGRRRGGLERYRVNVFVDNSGASGAPVVVEHNPTYYNLLGRVEYRATLGAMVTDFREIKAGALHRANGGSLVLDILSLLRHPFSWEALKRALLARVIRIENLAEEYSPVPTATLRPEPIPLDVKVVLIGPPLLYQLLYQLDEDFRELFKVKADFSPEMSWSEDHTRSYAAFVSRWVREAGLRDFDRSAVARLIEYGGRLRESQKKLSTRLIEISDIVSEASFWAGKQNREIATAADVDRAVAEREYRSSLLEERLRELIEDGTIMIETDGARVGQVNGIAVIDLGDYSFGQPSRVTARVSLGRAGVRSIEREIELSGPIHSKGVLILSGYLAAVYAQDAPLALAATLTFEQSYDEVEGDSASSTELFALLSALSGLPLEQGIAVTGSVNQHGEVQAVGGVTRKVEGFFEVCKAKGLTGRQGVVIPAANVENLMLRDGVVEAVRAGDFHVWAIHTIDEGLELLTGRAAGERQPDGSYPVDSVHGLAAARLAGYAERLRSFAASENGRPPDHLVTAARDVPAHRAPDQ